VQNVTDDSISKAEVTGISSIGLWLLAAEREYFIPFADYPEFRQATVEQIVPARKAISPTQLYWPDLDVDIALNALETPELFPLMFKR